MELSSEIDTKKIIGQNFLRVFQNFRGRQKVFLGFFEGFFVGIRKTQ